MNNNIYMNNNNILSKEDLLLSSLYEYYNNENRLSQLIPIITGKTKLSLRILDWFVTNYSKKPNQVIYKINRNNEEINFNVHQDYKNKLKSYNKRFFDPFCRKNKKNLKNKIAFKYDDNKYIITTIGQLNFFRWVIRNKIVLHILNNFKEITDTLRNTKKRIKIKKIIKINIKNKNENEIERIVDFNK